MSLSVAALLYRTNEVSDALLAEAFAVALAGWDVPAPRLDVAALRGLPGWEIAFYESGRPKGAASSVDELDHRTELFEDELPPGLAVREAAGGEAVVYAVLVDEEASLDDGWRFAARDVTRRFVREGDDGLEAGAEGEDEATVGPIGEEGARAHRGSTFVGEALGVALLPAIAGALFEADRRVPIRLVDPGPASIRREVEALCKTLKREPGRGAFTPPAVAGVAPPDAYAAFVAAYDFADPHDPKDLYRGLALGGIEGALSFLRAAGFTSHERDPAWRAAAARARLYPIALLRPDRPGDAEANTRTLAVAPDGETLSLVDAGGRARPAGPTLGELVRYLSLGFRGRTPVEEEMIEALMLRAKVRAG